MIKSLVTEYGFSWVFNRLLYSGKLKLIKAIPHTEKLFEKDINIKRIDICEVEVEKIEKFLIRLSNEDKKKIINTADEAIKGRILAFSSLVLDYGDPINWDYNPITNTKLDKTLKWYNIPDFNSESGDIKVVWEASRFTHFYYFARAFMITKEIKYYEAFSNQLENWVKSNPYSYGANYKCGQEATLRMINALIAYSVFKSYGYNFERDKKNLEKLVEDSYKKVLSNFFYAHKCIKNNHTLSEITGLIIGAWCCEDSIRLERAYNLLNKEISNQFFSDGGYLQYSFNYQRFALQIIEFVLSIKNKTNLDISKNNKNAVVNSVILMYQMQDENGDVPNYGSNDGALIFPVTTCSYRDFRPVLNSIYAILKGKRLYNPGKYDEELLWFMKGKIDNMSTSKLSRISSRFNKSGYYSLRNEKGFLMVVLQDYTTRPAQMDQLHIDIWNNGKNIFCDSGTFSYANDIGKHMSLTEAHNTVKVDDKEQMKKHGPFLVYDWSKVKNVEFKEDHFKGTMISQNGYSHTREINMKKNNYQIFDEVSGEISNCIFNFHTPYEVKIIQNGFEIFDGFGTVARVKTTGIVKVNKAYRSLYYLNKEEINQVSVLFKKETEPLKTVFEINMVN